MKKKTPTTRYHRVLTDHNSPYKRHQVVPDKKKQNRRKEIKKIINKTIHEE